jgi:transcriptional regulator with XRE-family HTH domain
MQERYALDFRAYAEKCRDHDRFLRVNSEKFSGIPSNVSVSAHHVSASPGKGSEETVNAREFGVRLTRYREERKLSMTELAQQLGLDYMSVHRYETGKHLPSFETAIRLANLLQVSLDVLATGKDAPAPPVRSARLLQQMEELESLPPERQELAARLLEAVVAGELDGLVRRLRRV